MTAADDRKQYKRGHALVRTDAGLWGCTCGEVYASTRAAARPPHHAHIAQPDPPVSCAMARIDVRGPDECHLFTGPVNSNGYGKITVKGRTLWAHRVMACDYHGVPYDSPLYACHMCDVRACCNPRHIFFGTAKDNMQDAFRKGRMVIPNRGSK